MKLFKGLLLSLSFFLVGAFAGAQAQATSGMPTMIEPTLQKAVDTINIGAIAHKAESPILVASDQSLFDKIATYNQKKATKTARPDKEKKSPIKKTFKKLSLAQQSKTCCKIKKTHDENASVIAVSPQCIFLACPKAKVTSHEFFLISNHSLSNTLDLYGFISHQTLAVS